jgi:CelD/BcsL family acetyltransferase involved in cellulose biosynthesis
LTPILWTFLNAELNADENKSLRHHMPDLTTQIIRGRKEAFELESEYRVLYDSLSCPNVYFSPEWVYTWLLSLGRSYNICFLTCRDSGTLTGVWPFFEYTQPVFGTGLMPVGAQVADSFDPIARPDCMETMTAALIRAAEDFTFIWLPLLTLDFTHKLLKPALAEKRPRHMLRKRTPRFLIGLDHFSSYQDFLDRVFGPKTRQSLRRKERKLQEAGDSVISFLEDPESIAPWLKKIMDLELASWKGEKGIGIFRSATLRSFYHLLLENLAFQNRLRLSILTIENQLAAYEIGLLGPDSYCMHTISFAPEFASISPGRLLMLRSLERCIQEKRKVYDFMQNDQEFKRQMSTNESSLWDCILFPKSIKGALVSLLIRFVHASTEWRKRRLKAKQSTSLPTKVDLVD